MLFRRSVDYANYYKAIHIRSGAGRIRRKCNLFYMNFSIVHPLIRLRNCVS